MLATAVIAFGLSCMTGLALAETVYVQARTAQLRSGHTSLDPVVENLRVGDRLEVLSKQGNWIQVKTVGGKTGWIYTNKISSEKPSTGDSELASLGRNVRKGDASSVTASAGARGLDKATHIYANKVGISRSHRDAVDQMTAYRLSDDEVQEFLRAGKLGEYAE